MAGKARGGLETIDIKGKAYVTVAERIKSVTDPDDLAENKYEIEKWERFELDGKNFLTCHIVVGNKSVLTEVSRTDNGKTEKTQIPVTLMGKRYSGTSQISFTGGMVNSTSGYENAETSALGRALGMAGIGLLEGVASADEIHKAIATEPYVNKNAAGPFKKKEPVEINIDLSEPVSVGETPISETSKTKLRIAFTNANILHEEVTTYCQMMIGKEKPTTEEDATVLLEQLAMGAE